MKHRLSQILTKVIISTIGLASLLVLSGCISLNH
jgi:hypothetical protein